MVEGLCIQRLERHLVQIFDIDRTGYQDSLKYDRREEGQQYHLLLDIKQYFTRELYFTKLVTFVFGKKRRIHLFTNKEIFLDFTSCRVQFSIHLRFSDIE